MPVASQSPVEVCPNHPEVSSGLIHCARCKRAWCSDCVVELDGKPYDAVCKEEQLRDLRSGTASAIELATASRRFVAMVVDYLVFLPVSITAVVLRGGQPQTRIFFTPEFFIYAALWIVYEGVMLSNYRGQTLGKKAMGLRVVNPDGSSLRPDQAWKRSISREVMAVTYVLAFVDALMVFSGMRRTLHDRFANTVVVKAKP